MWNSSCIIYYPIRSIWNSYDLVKGRCFSFPNIIRNEKNIEINATEEDYIIL